MHIHVCETKGQYLQGLKLFGVSPVMHLDRLGVLNERLSMAQDVATRKSGSVYQCR